MLGPFEVAIAGILAGTVITIVRTFGQTRAASASQELPPALDARLQRMEQALDAIAVEVERVSEGQRFTTRLLAERTTAAAPGQPVPGQAASAFHREQETTHAR